MPRCASCVLQGWPIRLHAQLRGESEVRYRRKLFERTRVVGEITSCTEGMKRDLDREALVGRWRYGSVDATRCCPRRTPDTCGIRGYGTRQRLVSPPAAYAVRCENEFGLEMRVERWADEGRSCPRWTRSFAALPLSSTILLPSVTRHEPKSIVAPD